MDIENDTPKERVKENLKHIWLIVLIKKIIMWIKNKQKPIPDIE